MLYYTVVLEERPWIGNSVEFYRTNSIEDAYVAYNRLLAKAEEGQLPFIEIGYLPSIPEAYYYKEVL